MKVPLFEEIAMCYPVPCATCGKTTWAGCGEHVESALAGVAPVDRCACAR